MKIGVFIPIHFPGGTLRLGKNIAKMLNHSLSKNVNTHVKVIFGNPNSGYSLHEDLKDLLNEGIEVVDFRWKKISQLEARQLCQQMGRDADLKMDQYVVPTGGTSDFKDLDYWLFITDRIFDIFIPIKRSGIIATDYIQRYVPGIFDINDQRHYQAVPHRLIRNTRNADEAFALSPGTLGDLKVFAGCTEGTLLPLVVDDDFMQVKLGAASAKVEKKNQFVWVTNTTQHKNHVNTLKGLIEYYRRGGNLDCIVTGVQTDVFDPKWQGTAEGDTHLPYQKQIREMIAGNPELSSRIKIRGHVSDDRYIEELSQSYFLLHSVIADNGTYSIIEAARLGIPAVSSRYPQQEYICELFGIKPVFFDPFDSKDLAKSLLSAQAGDFVSAINMEKIEKRLWKNMANEFCRDFISAVKVDKPRKKLYG